MPSHEHVLLDYPAKARNIEVDHGCIPAEPENTLTDRLNNLLHSSGDGYVLRLCQNMRYPIQAPIRFAHPYQEISTIGYPTDAARATIVVSGPVVNGNGHSAAVEGNCQTCDGIKLRNVQIEGNRFGAPVAQGGANIEMGGPNSDQLIEYVKSYDPRGWSCLHIAEGPLTCNNATVQNNEIGPCGTDQRSNWADGISLSCANSIVRNNTIKGATDGGIVVFGAPGSQIYNNTISVGNYTQLGGINLVDYSPYHGDYTGTVVRNNTILGAYANGEQRSSDKARGENSDHVFIKVGIAIGPRVWFGDKYGSNVSSSGIVEGNRLSGGFGYGIAVTSAFNFTIQDNVLFGNTSFFSERGPDCPHVDTIPSPGPFVIDYDITSHTTVQPEFEPVSDGDLLICVVPPKRGNYWPILSAEAPTFRPDSLLQMVRTNPCTCMGIVAGVFGLFLLVAVAFWAIRKWLRKRVEERQYFEVLASSPLNSPVMKEGF
uniref:Right handed beta helix domain-containing protein n=1 Tax=Moniliophthora roreri TaxID=221103 RepID=A0A0W0FM64_MONRR